MFTLIIIIIVLVFIFGGSGESTSSNRSTPASSQKKYTSFTNTISTSKEISKSNRSANSSIIESAKTVADQKSTKDRAMRVRVAGVTYEGRQGIISSMRANDRISLKRDKYNKYDKNAIGVYNSANQSIGWVPRDLSSTLAPSLDSGVKYQVKIIKLLGGNGYNYGLEVLITKDEEILKPSPVESYNSKTIKSISENKYSGLYSTVAKSEDENDYSSDSSSNYNDAYDYYDDDYNEYGNPNNDDYGDSEEEIWEHQWEYNQNH